MKDRALTLTALILGFASLTAAQGITTEYYPVNTTAELGENTTIGLIEVTADNTSAQGTNVSVEYPFNTSITPKTVDNLSANQSRNFTLTVSPSTSTPANNYSRIATVESENYSAEVETEVKVPSVNNWTASPGSVSRNLSLNTQGVFQEFRVEQVGNAQSEKVETNLTGNLSKYLSVTPEVQFFRDNPSNVSLSYDVPETLDKGFYNATLQFSSENQTQNISLNATLVDDIPPSIDTAKIGDVAATKSETWQLLIDENLNLSTVRGTVERQVQRNNSTQWKEVNEFDFEKSGAVGVYKHRFEATGEPGQYRLHIYVEDSSKNSANATKRFEVTELNALQVLERSIGFGYVIRGQEKSQTFLRLNRSTPVTVKYTGLTPPNASLKVGIKRSGEPAAQYFSGVGSEVEIEEKGNYSVVLRGLESDEAQSMPTVNLDFQTVEHHVEVPSVAVQSILIGGYGKPLNRTYGDTRITRYYEDYIEGVPQTKVMVVKAPAGGCRNVSTMAAEGCFAEPDGGLIENKTATIDSLRFHNKAKTAGLIVLSVIWILTVALFKLKDSYRGFLNLNLNEFVRRRLASKFDRMDIDEIEDKLD